MSVDAPALLLHKPAVARLLGISPRSLNRMIAGGRFGPSPAKLGGRIVFHRADVEAWAASAVDGEFPTRAEWAARRGAR